MENNNTSGPIEDSELYSNNGEVFVKHLECYGSTATMSLVRVGGKQYIKKQLLPEYAVQHFLRDLFRKEYEAGSKLDNPYIIHYERFVENKDEVYILAEYVCGNTLEDKIDNEPKYFTKHTNIERFVSQLLDALECMHSHQILHLDLKPDNIMFTQVGDNAKIVDLGFCFTDAYSYSSGYTPGFAAPEQMRRRNDAISKLDERTDIYAVGKLLEYIEKECDVTLPSVYEHIKKTCLKRNKDLRFRNVGEIKQIIAQDKQRRKYKKCACVAASILLIIIGLWAFLSPDRQDSFLFNNHYYHITSSDSLTCEIVGGNLNNSVMIEPEVVCDGRTYTVTAVADSAYKDSVEMRSIFIPKGIRRIGDSAFEQCIYFTTVNIPSTVTSIGKAAFRRCVSLSSVSLPNTLHEIPQLAFGTCMNLESIVVPEGVTTLGLDAFIECFSLQDIQLPSTLTTISRGVFWECHSLQQIHLPASVTYIGEYSFFHCPKLRDIYVHATTPPAITSIVKAPGVTFHVPAESLNAYLNDMEWRKYTIVGDL